MLLRKMLQLEPTVTGETINAPTTDGNITEENIQTVYGIANDTTIEANNLQMVENRGVANNSSAVNGGVIAVNNGVVNDTHIDSDSRFFVEQGAISNNADVNGFMQNGGGVDNGTVIEKGATFYLYGYNDTFTSVSKDATIKMVVKFIFLALLKLTIGIFQVALLFAAM